MNWWTAIIVALIASGPPTALAWLAWKQSKRTHVEVNSRFTKYLRLTGSSAYARGKLSGQKKSTSKQ